MNHHRETMATKKKTTKKAAAKIVVIDDNKRTRKGGRVPTDEERQAKGQIRRTLRISDATVASKFEKLEEIHGGTSGAVGALVSAYEAHVGPIE